MPALKTVRSALARTRGMQGRSFSSSAPRAGDYAATIPHLGVGAQSKVIVQGFTGKASTVHTQISMSMGTNVVGGVTPKKGGTTHMDRPVFDTLRQAVRELKPDATSVFVPPALAAQAILDAIEEEVPLIVSVAEGIPAKDQMKFMAALHSQSKSRLLGANSPGFCNPSGCRMGISPMITCAPGPIGIASRSGTLSYEASWATKHLGQSYVLGLGGDFYPGTRTAEAVHFFMNDPQTEAIVLAGEVGGTMEEEVYELLSPKTSPYRLSASRATDSSASPFIKPIVGFIAGLNIPPGQIFGHAGAIWRDGVNSAKQKRDLWEKAGICMAETIADVGKLIEAELDKHKRMLAK